MALAKTYLTVNGKIRSEQRAGEAHSRDYVLDRLGSVIQIYQNGWPIADACYEPYGGIYTQWNMEGKTFTWLGGWGYRQTGVEWSSVYVRARHYSRGMSNWTSIDPLWPSEMAYGYVEGRVMAGVDPSGRRVMLCRRDVAIVRDLERWWPLICPPSIDLGLTPKLIPDSTKDHWYLVVTGKNCNTTMGWGPQGIYDTAYNLGGERESEQRCITLNVSIAEERCLCSNFNAVSKGNDLAKKRGNPSLAPILCGKTWLGNEYGVGQVCQTFVDCLMFKCGLALPPGWVPVFGCKRK